MSLRHSLVSSVVSSHLKDQAFKCLLPGFIGLDLILKLLQLILEGVLHALINIYLRGLCTVIFGGMILQGKRGTRRTELEPSILSCLNQS